MNKQESASKLHERGSAREEAENSESIVVGEENYGKIVIEKRLIKNK